MAKPVVDGLEHRNESRLTITHVNIGDDDGNALATRYGIKGVPAFVLLDGKGNEVWRQVGGRPNVAEIEGRVTALTQPQ